MIRLQKFSVSVAILLVLAATVFSQNNGLPRLKKGESYGRVRVKMLKAGWKPYHSPNTDKCQAGDKRCEGRPEMENCTGTGLAPCRFLWKRKGKILVIFSVGENAVYNGYKFQ